MADHIYVGAGSGLRLTRAPGEFPRKGAWAIYDGKVGIIAEITDPMTCELHVVDDTGATVMVLTGVPLGALVHANYEHIPAPRRPDLVTGHRLGYKSVPGSSPSLVKRVISRIVG